MIVGAVAIFVVKTYISIEGKYFYEMLPGVILVFVAIILVSRVTETPAVQVLEKIK